jgi:hypothetical protein
MAPPQTRPIDTFAALVAIPGAATVINVALGLLVFLAGLAWWVTR